MIKARIFWAAVLLFLQFILPKTCNANSTTLASQYINSSSISSPSSTAVASAVATSNGGSTVSFSESISDTALSTTPVTTDVTVNTISTSMPYTTETTQLMSTTAISLPNIQRVSSTSSEVVNQTSSTVQGYPTVSSSLPFVAGSATFTKAPSTTNTTSYQTSTNGNENSTSMLIIDPTTTVLSVASNAALKSSNVVNHTVVNNNTTYVIGVFDSMATSSAFATTIQHPTTSSTFATTMQDPTYSVIMKPTENLTIYTSIKSSLYSTNAAANQVSTAPTKIFTDYTMSSSFVASIFSPWKSSALTSAVYSAGQPLNFSLIKQVPGVSIKTTISTSHFPLSSSASIVTTARPLIPVEFLIFRVTSLLANSTFTEDLNNRTSNNYSILAMSVKDELHMILNESRFYNDVKVANLLDNNSSVEVVADVYYNFSTNVSSENIRNSIQSKSRRFVAISVKELCSNVSCSNGGSCQESSEDVLCSCTIGFNGVRCLRTYPVDGNYTEWSSYQSCSKSCGGGFQMRTRTCTNPVPMHSGRNCSSIGAENETKSCNEHGCPDIDWVIWLIIGAGAFILLLVVILACCFQKRKKFYYKDYGLTQDGRSYSLSRAAYVNQAYDGNLSEFRTQENTIPMEILKEDPFKNSYTNQQFEADEANHNGNTVYERELRTFLGNTNKIRAKDPATTGEYLEPERTFHSPKQPENITTAQVVYENTPERLL